MVISSSRIGRSEEGRAPSFFVIVPVRTSVFPNFILEPKYRYCVCDILRRAKIVSPFVTFVLNS